VSDLVHLVPRPQAPDHKEQVHAATVELLERLLERARGGELVNAVVIAWQDARTPEAHWSTEDKILALGAVRTMEHVLVRAWLDA
jgi:hypothetical protein